MAADKSARDELKALQAQLLRIQHVFAAGGHTGVIVLEGWDAAGKGGLIRRIAWTLDPRYLDVWPIKAPDARERRELWLQRFWERLPTASEIAIFDRSWYGRVLVEPIEGFITEAECERAYDEINAFERTLVDNGVRLVKLFLDIDADTQLARFRARYENPAKRWKLTEDDIRNRARWQDYEQAYARMFERCSTSVAPWTRIDANHKSRARVAALQRIVEVLGAGLDLSAEPQVDPIVERFMLASS